MTEIAIQVEDLGKQYRIGGPQTSYRTLRESLVEAARAPFQRLSSVVRGHSSAASSETIWALRDVSFEVERGEVLGIIGRNGAGKTTLLKILSRITEPTEGRAQIRGRVGSLLEVGTGLHPELTGRENVYLYGAILGMKRADIDRKFDEIVAFAETAKFLDTPLKHYSAGMYMRLAFAVAAHLEPEILLVDEVLAVGDVRFQKKCLGKMRDIAGAGRTVLFVSHDMDAVQRLCQRCVLLDSGRLAKDGDSASIVRHYSSTNTYRFKPNVWIDLSLRARSGTGAAQFVAVRYSSLEPSIGFEPYSDGELEFDLVIVSDARRPVGSLSVTFYTQLGNKLIDADTNSIGQVIVLERGDNLVKLRIQELHLNPGVYRLGLWLSDPIAGNYGGGAYDFIPDAFDIEVFNLQARRRITSKATVSCDVKLMDVRSLPAALSHELRHSGLHQNTTPLIESALMDDPDHTMKRP